MKLIRETSIASKNTDNPELNDRVCKKEKKPHCEVKTLCVGYIQLSNMIAQQTATMLTHPQRSTVEKVATMHTCSQYKPSCCVYWTDRRQCASGPSPSLSTRDRLAQETLAPQDTTLPSSYLHFIISHSMQSVPPKLKLCSRGVPHRHRDAHTQ